VVPIYTVRNALIEYLIGAKIEVLSLTSHVAQLNVSVDMLNLYSQEAR
jgi:hypothetical protein